MEIKVFKMERVAYEKKTWNIKRVKGWQQKVSILHT